jgi:hypothetical protein
MGFVMQRWREPHPLHSTRLKIKRAEAHLKTIESYVPKYEALNPYGIAYQLNADKTFHEGRLQARIPPFLDFGILAGEFAYQLRSALDNLIYALSSPNFPGKFGNPIREKAERSAFFAICRTKNDSAVRGGIAYVADDIREQVFDTIDKHQPYKAGNRAPYHLISALDEINIRDKHRVLNAVTGSITISTDNLPEGVQVFKGGSAGHDEVVVRLPANLDPERDFNPRLSFNIILPVGRPAGGMRIETLRVMYEHIRDKVIPDFVGFFPPET